MTGEGMNQAWVLLAPVLLGAIALAGAALNGALAARAEGRPALSGSARPMLEVVRLMRQRRRVTVAADRLLWRIGGMALLVIALLKTAVIPFGPWILADIPVGLVWFNAMDVMVWAAIWLMGWGANSAHALAGGYRFLAQAASYELPLMFALVTPAVAAQSLRVSEIVDAQQSLWFVVWMPVAFLVFCASVLAFSAWGPFATAASGDIAGGILTEVSGVDRLLILAGRYALLATGAAFAVALFLGGGAGPLLPEWLWTLVKTLAVLAVFIVVSRRFSGVRPDRLAEVAWVIGLPIMLLQTLVVSIIVAVRG